MNPVLLAAAALVLPPIWGWLVWWALDHFWPTSPESSRGDDDDLPRATDPGLLDFQI